MINDKLSWTTSNRIKTSNQYPIYEIKHISSALYTQVHTRIVGAIINHGTITGPGFLVGEVFTGGTSGQKGTITAVGANQITYKNTVDYTAAGAGTVGYTNEYVDGETITGGTSGTTATITNHDTGAHCYYDYNTSSVRLRTGLLSGQKVTRVTSRYSPYFPGFEQSPTMTGVPDIRAGVTTRIIYGDSLNGIGLCIVGNVPNILLRSNVSGSPKDKLIPQYNWEDLKNLDLAFGQIVSSYMKWLGYGNIGTALTIGGYDKLAYQFETAGFEDNIYMRTPSNPLTWEIENTAGTTGQTELREVCGMVQSEGGYILPGVEFSADIPFRGAAAGQSNERTFNTSVFTPCMAIRLKNGYPTGKPNRKTVRLLDYEFGARTDDISVRLHHVHGVTACNGTWTSVDGTSAIEYNTTLSSITAMHKHLVQPTSIYTSVGVGGGSTNTPIDILNNHAIITQNPESDNSEYFLPEVVTRSGSAAVTGHMTWIESE